jgi:hypothetical protein
VNIKTTLKSSVAAAALFAIAAPVAPSVNAADDTLKSGNKNSLTVSGQVVRTLFYADDGLDEASFQSDGGITSSRVRWVAKGTVNENMTMGATMELNAPLSNPQASLLLNNGTSPGASTDTATQTAWGVRHQFIWVKHKRMGKVSLGQTNSASNGRSETTFSGVNMAADSGGTTFGTGNRFIDTTAGTQSISATTVGAVFTNFDGRSRTDVLRYDSPRFNGLALAVSAIAGGDWDVGADYRVKTGAIKIRIQAQHNNNGATSATVGGSTSFSAAALHDSGLNAAFAYGRRELDGNASANVDDPTMWDFDIGYRAKIFGIGPTNFSFNRQTTDDLSGNDTEAVSTGFTIAQIISPVGASMALGYKNYAFDTATNTFDDIDVISLQTVFKF